MSRCAGSHFIFREWPRQDDALRHPSVARHQRAGYFIGRATLGSPEAPEAQLLFTANAPISFRNGVWSAAYPDIAVFDGAYVSENVFAGDFVDTAQRRNLYRVIIGAQGVALATRITEIDGLVRTKNEEIRTGRAGLQRHIPPGMTVEIFAGLAEDAAIDERIAVKERELQAAQQTAQLQQRPGLDDISCRSLIPASRNCSGRRFRLSQPTQSGA